MKSCFIGLVFVLWAFTNACKDAGTETRETNNILEEAPYLGLTDSIHADPDNVELYKRRAALLMQADELELAYKDLATVSKLEPTEANAEQLVNLLFMTGQNRTAVQLLDELIRKYPDNENFQRRLSEALVNNGATSEAIQAYDKMIAEDSANFEAWFERGLLFLDQKDTGSAIKDMERSYALQPLQLTGLTLANIYAERKNQRTLELTDLVISRDSLGEMADPYFIKGVYYANIGNSTRALELFNTCIRMNWKFQEAYVEKGMIYFDNKNLDEALQQFKLAATVSNTYPEAYYWQGRCYEALGMNEEALANYIRAYSLDRSFQEAIDAAERVEGKK